MVLRPRTYRTAAGNWQDRGLWDAGGIPGTGDAAPGCNKRHCSASSIPVVRGLAVVPGEQMARTDGVQVSGRDRPHLPLGVVVHRHTEFIDLAPPHWLGLKLKLPGHVTHSRRPPGSKGTPLGVNPEAGRGADRSPGEQCASNVTVHCENALSGHHRRSSERARDRDSGITTVRRASRPTGPAPVRARRVPRTGDRRR